ncbi:hypothetical protein [Marasmitruncus massiliensis]|uniref:hypothetical protein n=1 Tax=Marasmitruncus massiliensis TaxID=1944642 RepID=UPI000C79CE1F|nr:hypothetical protein [Marasmitruncus massiliensis]
MIRISTWSDVQSLKPDNDPGLYLLLSNRFKQLHQIFCSNSSVPLERFSLQEYGELFVVENGSELTGKLFEQVTKHTFSQKNYYVAVFLFNSEVCSDFLIPAENLNDHQIQQLEQEL